tara:strand:- start:5186 stop:5407 length:222 start_codon:yes stop_codon:yes gene_type:complete
MKDKLGPYIQNLMTIVIDKEQDQFVIDLSYNELKNIKSDIEDFLMAHRKDESDEIEKTEKILLQEQEEVNTNG